MELTLFAGSASLALGRTISEKLGLPLGSCALQRFPDGEMHVLIQESLRGHDVYLVQSTHAPVGEHLLELMLMGDACRRAGAGRVTAVVPYLGYARQDRRASGREPVGARVVADLLGTGLDRVVAVDLHTPAIEGVFSIPLEHLSAVPLLVEAARACTGERTVIVSPDLGAMKLAERYARALHAPVVVIHKTRRSGAEVSAEGVVGEVAGSPVLLIDDMISTGGTIEAAVRALLAAGALPEVTVVATHALFAGPAVQRLRALPIQRIIATDSVPRPADLPLPLQVVGLGPLLAEAIARLHDDRSLGDLISHR